MRKVLHVGCGAATIEKMPEGFRDGSWEEVRFDINPKVRPDLIGTITEMSAVQTNSVDAVYSSHNIEHVYPHEVPAVLGEFKRVIKEDGFAVITCPDLKAVAEKIVEAGLSEPLYHSAAGPISPLDVLYGTRVEPRDSRR
jgi:predicted SAM-dependent methyltransferase